MKKDSLFCIKIGGSVITDKTVPYKAQADAIRLIAKSLKKVNTPYILAHGSGSFGHTSAKKYGGRNGYTDKWGIAKVSLDAQEINRIVMDILVEEGIPAISFSPRSFLLSKDGVIDQTYFAPILEAIGQGLVPVVYGDVIWDSKQKTTILSGETILNELCRFLQTKSYTISRVIQLCNVDGVLDADKRTIPVITEQNWNEIQMHIESIKVADVTGGMKHKIEDALSLTHAGIETVLLNGASLELYSAIKGQSVKGTVIRTL